MSFILIFLELPSLVFFGFNYLVNKTDILQLKGREIRFRTSEGGVFSRILMPANYFMEIAADGFRNKTIQFAVTEKVAALGIPNKPL